MLRRSRLPPPGRKKKVQKCSTPTLDSWSCATCHTARRPVPRSIEATGFSLSREEKDSEKERPCDLMKLIHGRVAALRQTGCYQMGAGRAVFPGLLESDNYLSFSPSSSSFLLPSLALTLPPSLPRTHTHSHSLSLSFSPPHKGLQPQPGLRGTLNQTTRSPTNHKAAAG